MGESVVGIWLGFLARTGRLAPITDSYPCQCEYRNDQLDQLVKIDRRGKERENRGCSEKWCPCAYRTDVDALPVSCCARNQFQFAALMQAEAEVRSLLDRHGLRPADWGGSVPAGDVVAGVQDHVERDRPTDHDRQQGAGAEFQIIPTCDHEIPSKLAGEQIQERPATSGARGTLESGTGSDATETWEEAVAAAKRRIAQVYDGSGRGECSCPTPWDSGSDGAHGKGRGGGGAVGVHCVECHENFASLSVFLMHKADCRVPCKDPGDLVDSYSGRGILRMVSRVGLPMWVLAR